MQDLVEVVTPCDTMNFRGVLIHRLSPVLRVAGGEQLDHSPFFFLLEQRNSACVYFIVSRLICIYIRADTGLFTHAKQHITLQTAPVTSAGLLGSSRNSTSSVWLQRDISGISPEKALSPPFSSSPDITTT